MGESRRASSGAALTAERRLYVFGHSRPLGTAAIATVLCACAWPAIAQTSPPPPLPPTREEVTRPEIQQNRERLPPQLEVQGAIERAPCALDDPKFANIRFTLRKAEFDGLRGLPPDILVPSYAPLIGTEQPISVVCAIRDRASALLRRAGYIAAVEVPEQRIEGGEIRFQVVLAHLTQVRVRGHPHGAEKTIAGFLAPLAQQPVFNRFDAERYLLLASDIPGYTVRLTLRPAGTQPGEVIGDVTVERTPVYADATIQNGGSKELGRWGGFGRVQLFGLTGLADRTVIAAFTTSDLQEQRTLQLGHDFAVGAEGLRIGALVTGAWAKPSIGSDSLKSTSVLGTIYADYPLVRTLARTLHGSIGLDLIDQDVDFNGRPYTRDRLRVAFARLAFDATSTAARQRSLAEPEWRFSALAELRKGLDVLSATQPCGGTISGCAGDVPPTRLAGIPTASLVRLFLSGEYRPIPKLTFSLAARGQYAWDPLLSFEEFAAGNYTVGRGYDPGTLLGDRGWGTQAEIRFGSTVPQSARKPAAETYLFFDHAKVSSLDGRLIAGSSYLDSTGGGLRVAFDRFMLDTSLAVPLTHVGPFGRKPGARIPDFAQFAAVAVAVQMKGIARLDPICGLRGKEGFVRIGALALALFVSLPWSAPGAAAPLSVRDNFRIGSTGTSFCSAQPLSVDPALTGMFDVGYTITCRDAALPVGRIYSIRATSGVADRLAAARARRVTCDSTSEGTIEQLGAVEVIDCKLADADVGYRVYQVSRHGQFYAAEGLAGYDSALRLGLRSVIADEPVEGEVSIATTGVGDPASFARVQAGTLDPTRALAEAYRRNNGGSYADAAEFFAAVGKADAGPISRAEALINEALQKSNLGRYAEADALFGRAEEQARGNPIDARRLRNYKAIHLLNQGEPAEALKELDKPVVDFASSAAADARSLPVIDSATAERLNAERAAGGHMGQSPDDLLPEEKAQILDGQALQLRGTSLRLKGDVAAARDALSQAETALERVRNGRVRSIAWMRAQIVGDLAAIAEESGDIAQADTLYRQGVAILEANYPGSAALLNAQARLAGFVARQGQMEAAESIFRDIVHSQPDATNLPPSFARVLRPYVDILLKKPPSVATTAEIFASLQLMMRPGLAQTQAVLARELTGGSSEASRLFRQAVTLTRQVERARVALARYEALPNPPPAEAAKGAALKADLETAQKEAVATQAALASFPRYRAISSEVVSLEDLQKALRPGEAYYKMTIVDDGIYVLFATPTSARAARLDIAADDLDSQVASLRETISTEERGRQVTYAYDVALAHKLYEALFAPFATELAGVKHLIFEPDGAMLRMPPNPLVVDQQSVDLYTQRVKADPKADFDFTGIHWFGRDRDISTSVSPKSFLQLRGAPPSSAPKLYLGFGHNTPPSANVRQAIASADRDCVLPLASWQRPISARELEVAGSIMSRIDPAGVAIVTGDEFTDSAIDGRTDLDKYRIIHFATHGVVTATRPKCPTQPALLTSFGGQGSDGLLTFRDIFDLHLDADLVVLSACDTAGEATALATQSAGLATGGDVALDGLVRAFVGAGARLVIASHWPVPDDFNATERLITGLFSAPPGVGAATALRLSERKLMDDRDTSHPFYWSAFAAVGDGEMPVIRTPTQIARK